MLGHFKRIIQILSSVLSLLLSQTYCDKQQRYLSKLTSEMGTVSPHLNAHLEPEQLGGLNPSSQQIWDSFTASTSHINAIPAKYTILKCGL